MRSLLYSIVLAASVTAVSSSDAQAWWGGWGGGYGYYNVYSQDYVPYYSMHPPVYYSYPVPRTYGYSPFAYPPGTRTPDYVPGLPIEIINPHVRSTEPAKAVSTGDKTAVVPQVLINPYVVGSMKTASSASADVETDAR